MAIARGMIDTAGAMGEQVRLSLAHRVSCAVLGDLNRMMKAEEDPETRTASF